MYILYLYLVLKTIFVTNYGKFPTFWEHPLNIELIYNLIIFFCIYDATV